MSIIWQDLSTVSCSDQLTKVQIYSCVTGRLVELEPLSYREGQLTMQEIMQNKQQLIAQKVSDLQYFQLSEQRRSVRNTSRSSNEPDSTFLYCYNRLQRRFII